MGLKQDINESLKEYKVFQIDGQPTIGDFNDLVCQLCCIPASIPTSLGGGKHRHVGIVMSQLEHTVILKGGITFDKPTNPGTYPIKVSTDMITCEHELAECKAKLIECETYIGIEQGIRVKIAWAMDKEWLESIKNSTIGLVQQWCQTRW